MKPIPAECKRPIRVIVSLPNDTGDLLVWQPGRMDKSIIVDDALRLYFSMSENERRARLMAVRFNSRATVQ